LQTALPSAIPQSPPSYAQYSDPEQVSPMNPPHCFGWGHGFSVHASWPSMQLQVLQPSGAGMLVESSG
jgi:hypothetical protein